MKNPNNEFFKILGEQEFLKNNEAIEFEKLSINEQNYFVVHFDNSVKFVESNDFVEIYNFHDNFLYKNSTWETYNIRQKVELKDSDNFVFVVLPTKDQNLLLYKMKNIENKVLEKVMGLTFGCNYTYEFVKKEKNVYYFK